MKILNQKFVNTLESGDVIEYFYDTPLNGRKTETAIFICVTQRDINKHDRFNKEVVFKTALKLRAIKGVPVYPDDNEYQTFDWIHKRDTDNYVTWSNAWNQIYVLSVNGEKCNS